MSDTDIVGPLFHVGYEDVELTWVEEPYAVWNEYYVEWDWEEFIFTEELGGVGPNFGVNRQEMITLDFEMKRQTDQLFITDSGTYTASFTLKFTDIDCEWCNGYIIANDQWLLDASIVPGTLSSTNAPIIGSGEDDIHRAWFDLDLDLLELDVEYDFSVDIYVEVTNTDPLPILYKPGFGINYLVNTEWRNGIKGDSVEIPPDMRPDYITAARALAPL